MAEAATDDTQGVPEVEVPKEPPLKAEEITENFVDAFAVMFASLSTILLAFFIMLNALSKSDSKKQLKAMGSLLGSFGVLPEGTGFSDEGQYRPSADVISLQTEQDLFATFDSLNTLDTEVPDDAVMVYVDEEGRRRIRFAGQFLFASGSDRLNPRLMPVLDRLANMLSQLDRPFEVEGHTDEARGRESNWVLSATRAAAVLRYLEGALDADHTALSGIATAFADSRPLGKDHASNRRVEIVVN